MAAVGLFNFIELWLKGAREDEGFLNDLEGDLEVYNKLVEQKREEIALSATKYTKLKNQIIQEKEMADKDLAAALPYLTKAH